MLVTATAALLIFAFVPGAMAQGPEGDAKKEPQAKPAAESTPPPKEESSVTDYSTRLGSKTISYKAMAGTISLKLHFEI